MEKKHVLEDLAEIPPGLRPLVEQFMDGGMPEVVQHRWRRSGGVGRYRARGTDIEVGRTDSASDVVLAVLALAEEVDAEQGSPVQHQARCVRDGEPGSWVRFSLAEPGSRDVAESALRFASHAERVAVRAMGYLEQNLKVQAEMSSALAQAMEPQVKLRRLELQHEQFLREQAAREANSEAVMALAERLAPVIAAMLQQRGGRPGSPPKG